MSKLSVLYEMKPVRITQEWGRKDDFYLQFGFNEHNGTDYALGKSGELRAGIPCEVTKVAYQPNGAGYYICLLSLEQYDFEDGKRAHVELTYMHLDPGFRMAPVGSKLAVGDYFATGDNTGVSTGPHTHVAAKRVKKNAGGYYEIDTNGAKNTFDLEKYRPGGHAVDAKTVSLLSTLLGLLRRQKEYN